MQINLNDISPTPVIKAIELANLVTNEEVDKLWTRV